MPTIKLTVDLDRFRAALRNVMTATKKTESEIVNRAARNIAFRAASFTPKAAADGISSGLKTDGLLPRLASAACNKKFGLKKWGRKQHREMMKAILKRRRAGVGALRAGWIPAIQALGGSYRGAKLDAGRSAASGYAFKASANDLSALIVNNVTVVSARGKKFQADQIPLAVAALERAVNFVTEDIEGYAIKKMNETLEREGD